MRPRTLIILIALLAALAAYFFLVEERERRRLLEQRLATGRLLPYGPRDVDRVLLNNPYGDSIEMVRHGDGWLIIAPIEDIGDTPAIEMFLHLIVPGRILTDFGAADDPGVYGLAPPFATVILESGRHGRSDTIHVGDRSPTTERAYVCLGSSRTVKVARELTREVVRKKPIDFREKNLVPENGLEVTGLTVNTRSSRLDISRSESGWILGSSALRADRLVVEPYLTRLFAAIIYAFSAESAADSARFGIGAPPRELLLRTDPPGTIRLSFGRRSNHFVPVLRSGRDKIMMIESDFLEPFNWVQDHAISMNLTLADPDEVASMLWEWPDRSVFFERLGDGWRAVDEAGTSFETETPQHLLLVLGAALFESLIDDPVPCTGAFDPVGTLRIELRDDAGRTLDIVRISRRPDGKVLASSLTAETCGYIFPVSMFEFERAFDR